MNLDNSSFKDSLLHYSIFFSLKRAHVWSHYHYIQGLLKSKRQFLGSLIGLFISTDVGPFLETKQ